LSNLPYGLRKGNENLSLCSRGRGEPATSKAKSKKKPDLINKARRNQISSLVIRKRKKEREGSLPFLLQEKRETYGQAEKSHPKKVQE